MAFYPWYPRLIHKISPIPPGETVSEPRAPKKDQLPFAVRERVRWSDCDPLGIIYYGAYIRYFEAAEHEMFRAAGLPYEVMRVQRHEQLPRKAFAVEFHSPAQMDELLEVRTGVARIGETSITLRFEAYDAEAGTHRASASLTVVCVDKESITKRPLPEFVKEALRPYLVPAA
jgi:acyl-CoA thioester hydrolase